MTIYGRGKGFRKLVIISILFSWILMGIIWTLVVYKFFGLWLWLFMFFDLQKVHWLIKSFMVSLDREMVYSSKLRIKCSRTWPCQKSYGSWAGIYGSSVVCAYWSRIPFGYNPWVCTVRTVYWLFTSGMERAAALCHNIYTFYLNERTLVV